MPAINSRCRQPHKPGFLLLDSFRPVFRQALKSCTFLFFMLSGLLKPHNHPSLIPLISESQPFPAYSLLSFRECSLYINLSIIFHRSCLLYRCLAYLLQLPICTCFQPSARLVFTLLISGIISQIPLSFNLPTTFHS